MTLSSASAREDSTAYACMVVSSLVDLDKTFRYKTSEVEVLPQASTGERNGGKIIRDSILIWFCRS